MNDKDYRAEKKRVKKYLNKWKKTLGLGMHNIDIVWDRAYRNGAESVAIHCENSWQYRLAYWTVYTPVTADNDDELLEHIIIHELSHSLIAPLAQGTPEEASDKHEFATECVAQAIQWAYEAGKKDA